MEAKLKLQKYSADVKRIVELLEDSDGNCKRNL